MTEMLHIRAAAACDRKTTLGGRVYCYKEYMHSVCDTMSQKNRTETRNVCVSGKIGYHNSDTFRVSNTSF